MQDLPVQMHPRYQEFLAFMKDCPHRKTPECMQTAFWVWHKVMSDLCGHRWIETDKPFVFEKAGTDALKNDLDRLHRERDSFQQQSSAMASENERLSDELTRIKNTIAGFLNGGAVGERGDACMSIDGGNL